MSNVSERRPLPAAVVSPEPFQRAVERGTRTTDGGPGADYWVNRPTYDLDVELIPEGPNGEPRLEGRARIRYQNNSPDTLGVLVLELAQNHHKQGVQRNESAEITGGVDIGRLAVNGTGLSAEGQRRPTYTVSGTRLIVAPSRPIMPGATTSLDIEYAFTVPEAGISDRMGYSGSELYDETNLFHIAYFYPIVSVYDDVRFREDGQGWMTDRYLGRAEYYSDHGNYDLSITAPAEWLVQSTGTLENPDDVLRPEVRQRRQQAHQSDEPTTVLETGERATPADENGTLTWQYRAEDVRDVAFSVMRNGDWNWEAARTSVSDDGADGDGSATDYTNINTFWREQAPLWSEVTRYQQHAISFFSEFTGLEYPWPHMSAVEGMGIITGGMEFPMMTLMGGYNDESANALYNVTAHELSHMWIPMTVSTNERRHAWMDEGLTTFNEAAARKDFFPNNDTQPHIQDQERYIGAVLAGVEAPIMRWSDYHYTSASYGMASYPKPAAMMHALRGVMGEETFRDAYQGFYDAWAYKHPMPYDLFNYFEAAHGEDLDWLWDSFFEETWALDHALQTVQNTDEGVRVTVANEGNAVMPVDLTLTLANGDTMRRRLPVDPWLNGKRTVERTIPTDAPAERVEIDAQEYYPDTDRNDNRWTR
ncbi:MAG: peptidase [Bacteroidetes bacterium QS_8_68_15]|nr:MAG: peptidase [Bacteroidetes bacterium QS_8_68_15]